MWSCKCDLSLSDTGLWCESGGETERERHRWRYRVRIQQRHIRLGNFVTVEWIQKPLFVCVRVCVFTPSSVTDPVCQRAPLPAQHRWRRAAWRGVQDFPPGSDTHVRSPSARKHYRVNKLLKRLLLKNTCLQLSGIEDMNIYCVLYLFTLTLT